MLTTREDPDLPLARLRARDQLTEIRARDLRFSRAGEQTNWQVSVKDEAAAKDRLMSLLVSSGVNVSNFSRKEKNLEDVYIHIIERSQK